MTMYSRSLLLLILFGFVEIASSERTKPAERVKHDIDLAKCVATRKNKNRYMCFMEDGCLLDSNYAGADGWQPLQKKSCDYGFTIRSMTKNKWEIEIKESVSIPLTLWISKVKYLPLKLERTIGTNKQRIIYKLDESPGSGETLNCQIKEIEKQTDKVQVNYARLHLFCGTELSDTDVTGTYRSIKLDNGGKIDFRNQPFKDLPTPCVDMTGAIVRKPGFDSNRRTTMPREAFDHNVHDLASMCPTNFKTFHAGKEAVAIECEKEKEAYIVHQGGITSDKIEVFLKPFEVTCQTDKDDCMFCEQPRWSTWSRNLPSHLDGLSHMKFTAAVEAVGGATEKCPTLTCPEGSFYYPQIQFTSPEEPRCEYVEKEKSFEWTISVRDPDQWDRPRVKVEDGFCKDNGTCIPFPESMTSCPQRTPAFGACGKPILNKENVIECEPGLELHLTFTRRVPLARVRSIVCDSTLGKYVVTMNDGIASDKFTDETWIVCKQERKDPKMTYFEPKPRNPLLKSVLGGSFAFSIYFTFFATVGGTWFAVVKFKAFWKATELPPEPHKSQQEKEKNAAAKGGKTADGKDLTKKPIFSGKQPPPGKLQLPELPPDFIKPVKEDPQTKKLTIKELMAAEMEKTCIEPDQEEVVAIQEAERINEGTDDEDATGREVKEIQKED